MFEIHWALNAIKYHWFKSAGVKIELEFDESVHEFYIHLNFINAVNLDFNNISIILIILYKQMRNSTFHDFTLFK